MQRSTARESACARGPAAALAGSQREVDILWASGDERLLNIASGTCACCARIDCVSSAGQGRAPTRYVVGSKEKKQ
jgi:streptolysin S family bacteriocin protoxin